MNSTEHGEHLSQRDFVRLAHFIENYSGIKMPSSKLTMLEGRLRRRLRATGHPDFRKYCDYLFNQGGLEAETVHLIDAVTTNKTDFFREPEHFQFLSDRVIPRLLATPGGTRRPTIKIWSAACSIGAEPYTIAMVLADQAKAERILNFMITATDICTEVLATALDGIYSADLIAAVPAHMQQAYVMRSRDPHKGLVRIAPALRERVQFGRVNLMDMSYNVDRDMDVIFCRNILIYFDKPTQEAVLSRLSDHLRRGGYLFVGHSETLTGFALPLEPVGPTVYQRL